MSPIKIHKLLPIVAALCGVVHSQVNASGDSPVLATGTLIRLGEIVDAYHNVVQADLKCAEVRYQLARESSEAIQQLQFSGNASWLELQHANVHAAVAEHRRQKLSEVAAWLEAQSKKTVDSKACITSSAVIFTLPESSVPIGWVSIHKNSQEKSDSNVVTAASRTLQSAIEDQVNRNGQVDVIRRSSDSIESHTKHSELVTAEAHWLLQHHEANNRYNQVKASALLSVSKNAELTLVSQQNTRSESAGVELLAADVNRRLLQCVSTEAARETNGSVEAYHRWILDHAESTKALHSKGLISSASLFQSCRNVENISAFMLGQEELGTLKKQWLRMQHNAINIEPMALVAGLDEDHEHFCESLPELHTFRSLAVVELLFDSTADVVSLGTQLFEVQQQLAIHQELLKRLRRQSHPNQGEIAVCSTMVEALAQQSKDIRNKLRTLHQLSQVLPLVDQLANTTDNLQLINSMTLDVLMKAEELNINRFANQPFERELKTLQNRVVALQELQKQGFASKTELINAERETVIVQKKRTEAATMQRYHQARLRLISQLDLKLEVP